MGVRSLRGLQSQVQTTLAGPLRLSQTVSVPVSVAVCTCLIDPAPTDARVQWFTVMTKPTDAMQQKYIAYLKACLLSARLSAPSLAPYLLYLHLPDQPFEADDELTVLLTKLGARVIPHRLSFYGEIGKALRGKKSDNRINWGAFGRIDIPQVTKFSKLLITAIYELDWANNIDSRAGWAARACHWEGGGSLRDERCSLSLLHVACRAWLHLPGRAPACPSITESPRGTRLTCLSQHHRVPQRHSAHSARSASGQWQTVYGAVRVTAAE